MKNGLPAAARLMLACALAALVLRPCRGGRHPRRRRRRPSEGIAGGRRPLLRRDEGRRPDREPDHDPLGLGAPDDDRGPGQPRRTRSRTRRPTASASRSTSIRTRAKALTESRVARRASSPPSPPSSRGRSRRSRTSSSATSRTSRASGSRSSTRTHTRAACAAYEPRARGVLRRAEVGRPLASS